LKKKIFHLHVKDLGIMHVRNNYTSSAVTTGYRTRLSRS